MTRIMSDRPARRIPNRKLMISAVSILGLAVGLAAHTPAHARSKPFDFKTWDQYLGGGNSSQYSSLKQINKSNVSKLQPVWTFATGRGRPYNFNPIVIGKIMYLLARHNSIIAVDATTGKEIWSHPNKGRVGTRGINYWESKDGKDGRLFYDNNGDLTAIDARTGKTIASFGKDGRVDLRVGLDRDLSKVPPLFTSNPGRIYKNLIIFSLPAPGARYNAPPGDIHAYDVRTGKLKWVFHTVPEPGQPGVETWQKDAVGKIGGAHNWNELTIDEKRGIIYIPTGTARYDFYGGNRKGNDLYANCLLAINANTGKLIWYYQMVHHDLWDYDIPAAPKLITVRHNGKKVDAVAQITKQGLLFVFNRDTGKPLWPIKEKPVPQSDVPGEQSSPTQPFPTKPPAYARMGLSPKDINPYLSPEDKAKVREMFKKYKYGPLFTPPSLQGTLVMPSHQGGANWGESAIDPKNGTMYVISRAFPTLDKLMVPDKGSVPPPPNAGPDFVPYQAPYNFLLMSNGMEIIGPPWSRMTAYDLNKGTIKWWIPLGNITQLAKKGITGTGSQLPRGGPVVTAGGLIFATTSSDRMFHAYDEKTGKEVWHYQLAAASEGVPAVYEVDGREYITIVTGGNGMFGLRGTERPGPGRYVTFALAKK